MYIYQNSYLGVLDIMYIYQNSHLGVLDILLYFQQTLQRRNSAMSCRGITLYFAIQSKYRLYIWLYHIICTETHTYNDNPVPNSHNRRKSICTTQRMKYFVVLFCEFMCPLKKRSLFWGHGKQSSRKAQALQKIRDHIEDMVYSYHCPCSSMDRIVPS